MNSLVSAGEIEQFVYCPHNWWLATHGVDGRGTSSRRGEAGHREAGAAQGRIRRARDEARTSLRWSFRFLAVAVSVTVLTLEVLYLDALPLPWLFIALGLVLVAASSGLLVIALDAEKRERKLLIASGLPPGDVLDSDLAGPGKLLHDHEWDLHGTPDSIIAGDKGPVPVEIKTARTPDRPHDNHRLQLAAYMRLLEAAGTPPSYGLLTYPGGVFPVQWDDALRDELRAAVDAIKAASAAGSADRNHNHAGRCRGCARRDACDQALA